VIEFRNVSKVYDGAESPALDGVSLTIERGEFFVLVGASGGGKSTALRMINRLVEPTSGEILIDEAPIRSLDLRTLRLGIGYVLQQIALFPNLTVGENIALIPRMKGWDKRRRTARAEELLEIVGMNPAVYLSRHPRELSGGEQQRIGILRALAAEPDVLLMDEPFSALDPIARASLEEFVASLQQRLGTTTVFVTHDMSEATLLADRIAVLRHGVVQQIAAPDVVHSEPSNEYVRDLLAAGDPITRYSDDELAAEVQRRKTRNAA
jgi:osmoprotectant transport system ATP-binding protein